MASVREKSSLLDVAEVQVQHPEFVVSESLPDSCLDCVAVHGRIFALCQTIKSLDFEMANHETRRELQTIHKQAGVKMAETSDNARFAKLFCLQGVAEKAIYNIDNGVLPDGPASTPRPRREFHQAEPTLAHDTGNAAD